MDYLSIKTKGKVIIDGETASNSLNILFTKLSAKINIRQKEGVVINVLNEVLSNIFIEEYSIASFDGLGIGFYHDTADPREGPYVNHNFYSINISCYRLFNGTLIRIQCFADYKDTSLDTTYYRGPTEGTMSVFIEFNLTEGQTNTLKSLHNKWFDPIPTQKGLF